MAHSVSPAPTKGLWKIIGAASAGTLIEWYDFYLFGSLATVISTHFFPPGHPTAAFLSTLAVFARASLSDRSALWSLATSAMSLGANARSSSRCC